MSTIVMLLILAGFGITGVVIGLGVAALILDPPRRHAAARRRRRNLARLIALTVAVRRAEKQVTQ